MTIDDLTISAMLQHSRQCLLKMSLEDGDDLNAINTWANAARAYSGVAQAMILEQAAPADAMDMARVFMIDTGL